MVENRSGSERLKKLEPIHERAALLLMQRGSMQAVADELGVSYDTVGNWKRSPKFKAYYRRLRREAYDEALAVLQAASLAAAAKIARATEWDDPDNIKVEVADGIVKAGRPDLALAAARMVMDLSAKWVDGVDVPAP